LNNPMVSEIKKGFSQSSEKAQYYLRPIGLKLVFKKSVYLIVGNDFFFENVRTSFR